MGKVNKIKDVEDWVATCKGTRKRFNCIWVVWQQYTSDPGHILSSLYVALLELADPSLRLRCVLISCSRLAFSLNNI